jgi:hypothetical protein
MIFLVKEVCISIQIDNVELDHSDQFLTGYKYAYYINNNKIKGFTLTE